MTHFPQVKLIRSELQRQGAVDAAKADNDMMHMPSHVLMRDGDIVGAASLGVVPMVLVWHHTQKVGARDSLHLKQVYDAIMETKGCPVYFIACNKHSPFHPHMKSFGYQPVWETEIYVGGQ